MTTEYLRPNQPDILEVIANLSNDAVFTPPGVVNAVLDLLPSELWSDPTLRWLDPASKTGVFPREITKRLMVGLIDEIPDEEARLRHILSDMVFAIATEEITGMMTRRTLYCSRDASGPLSATPLGTSDGNVWHARIEHSFDEQGRCTECRGSRDQLEVPGRDNKAYAFIHADGRSAMVMEIDMNFDVIVGNPPYQMDAESGNRTIPIYNLFVDEAKQLNPRYLAFVIPSRWMASGLGLSAFRADMLADKRIRALVDYPNASEVFPGVEIKGGVCYLFWDRDDSGTCEMTVVRGNERVGPTERDLGQFDVLVRDSRALVILEKVLSAKQPSIVDIFAADKEFGMTSNFGGYRTTKAPTAIAVHAVRSGRRIIGWMREDQVLKSRHLVDKWKVLVPQAGSDGGQNLPDVVLGAPLIAAPPSVCTQTFLFAYVESQEAAESVESYIRTRLVRFLISLRKISQHATRSTYSWVPQQAWDRQWNDEMLYQQYGITAEEQSYIAEMVKEMPA